MSASVLPDLIPARMVNEYCYCPRLFFLEWVQGRFADNEDTAEGRYAHRAMDKESGSAPLPEEEGDLIAARSLMLSSEKLGLVARIDLVEGSGDEVHPLDVKKGRTPNTPERSWEPERIQLCVQALLLREAGYRCSEGILYYAGSRQRVIIPIDDALIARTLEVLEELRSVASCDTPPPPLIASPKCPRCSLVGLCLPDETNALAARSDLPVRRLLPKDPAARPLYITEQGATLRFRGGRLEISANGEELASLRPIDVSQVNIYGNAQVTTQALRELFSREIPVCWFSFGGWFAGIAHGLPSKHVELRRRQVAIAHQSALDIARRVVEGKIRNSRTLLRRNARSDVSSIVDSLKRIAEQVREAQTFDSLLGFEGAAGRMYFEAFPAMIKFGDKLPGGVFAFDGRNRRPPRDPINALLSYLYSLLTKDLTVITFAVGFDPYLGFYHRPRFGRPALALDLAEEFRPLIAESTALNLINNGEINGSDFVVRAGGVTLTPDGRRTVLRAYERRLGAEIRHPVFGYRVSYRRVLDVQARLLGAHLLGEVPEYVPFVTR
jgi:CRISPR-associated protein Cas1